MKMLPLSLCALLLLTACNSTPSTPVKVPPDSSQALPNSNTEEAAPAAETPDFTSYHSDEYGLSFDYPAVWSLYEGPELYFVKVSIPSKNYEGTNFEQASLGVSAKSAASLEECISFAHGSSKGFDVENPITINDHTYYAAQGGDSGMGHWGYLHYYNTYRNGTCFSIVENVVITSPAPEYHSTPFTEVDVDDLWSRLDEVLQTMNWED
jgi:hypothetical protein